MLGLSIQISWNRSSFSSFSRFHGHFESNPSLVMFDRKKGIEREKRRNLKNGTLLPCSLTLFAEWQNRFPPKLNRHHQSIHSPNNRLKWIIPHRWIAIQSFKFKRKFVMHSSRRKTNSRLMRHMLLNRAIFNAVDSGRASSVSSAQLIVNNSAKWKPFS